VAGRLIEVDEKELFGSKKDTIMHEDSQSKQSPDNSFPFQYVQLGLFDIAGRYELSFTVEGALMYDVSEKRFKPIEWKKIFKIAPNVPTRADFVQHGADEARPVLSLGCKQGLIRCCFRDKSDEPIDTGSAKGTKGKGKKGSGAQECKGNLCPLPKKMQLEFKDVQPEGLVLSAERCDSEEAVEAARQSQVVTFNVESRPSQNCPALKMLRDKAGRQLQARCTLVFTYKESKRKSGKDEAEEEAIEEKDFCFEIEAGDPYELQLSTANKQPVPEEALASAQDALPLHNRSKLAPIQVLVLDWWGCRVAKYKDKGLLIQEQLVYAGDLADLKKRKETNKTLEKLRHEVDEAKGKAVVGNRLIVLRQPAVTAPELHRLECVLLSHDGTPLSKYLKIKNNPLALSINIKPSTLPDKVRVWVGDKMLNAPVEGELENPVPTTAGAKQELIKFEFIDEAGRPVALKKEDGWTVEGGGWGSKPVPCFCRDGFVHMPPGVAARERAGDSHEHTIIFHPPAKDETDAQTVKKVNINLVSVAAGPCQWVICQAKKAVKASPAKAAAKPDDKSMHRCEPTRPVVIKSGQQLCEVLCVRLEDKFGNFVPLEAYAPELQPQVLTSGAQHLNKGGDWKPPLDYDAGTDSFRFKAGICLKGRRTADSKVELRIVTHANVAERWKGTVIQGQTQCVQMAAGDPHRVRLSIAGCPDDARGAEEEGREQAQGAAKGKTLPTVVDGSDWTWPTLCRIDEVCLEVVDEAGNLVDNASSHDAGADAFTLALRHGHIACQKNANASAPSAPKAKDALDPIKLDKKEWCKKLKRVCLKGNVGTPAVLEASVRLSGYPNIEEATATINFRASNVATGIELGDDEVPKSARPGQRISVRARVATEDMCGLDKEALVGGLRCALRLPCGKAVSMPGKVELARTLDICQHNQVKSECHECSGEAPPEDEPVDPWLRWVVDPKEMQQAGRYCLTLSFNESRPDIKAAAEALQLAPIAPKEVSFSVLPGAPWHLKIKECQTTAGPCEVPSISNMDKENIVVHKIALQLVDAYRNAITVAPPGCKVLPSPATLHPSPDTQRPRRSTRPELCAPRSSGLAPDKP
jgi:hypothetical protein